MAAAIRSAFTGKWRVGSALDLHTVSSMHIGIDQFGHNSYDTKRSEMGELLYQLKYQQNTAVLPEFVDTIAAYVGNKFKFEVIVPVPATKTRAVQPVPLVADALGAKFSVPVAHCITATRATAELKDSSDPTQRKAQLQDLYAVDSAMTRRNASSCSTISFGRGQP